MINRRVVISVTVVAAPGGLLFGFATAIISGVVPYLGLNAGALGWPVGCILLGYLAGVLVAGWLASGWRAAPAPRRWSPIYIADAPYSCQKINSKKIDNEL